MTEEVKKIRLNKVAKELNVSVNRLVEFLAKKGYHVESNPNAKISPEEYELLAKAFKSEREVKENAEKIEISTNVKNTQKLKASEESKDNDEEKELVIEDNVSSLQNDDVVSVKENDIVEEKNAEVEQKEPDFEPQIIQAKVSRDNNGEAVYKAEIRIVDKINLDSLNVKNRPDKKNKEEREQERIDKKALKEQERQKSKQKKEEKKNDRANEKRQKNKAQQPQNSPKKDVKDKFEVADKSQKADQAVINQTSKNEVTVVDKKVPVQEKEPEFIETQYQKLEGPKVVSKIDLSQFNKPKTKNEPKQKNNEENGQSDEDKKKKKT